MQKMYSFKNLQKFRTKIHNEPDYSSFLKLTFAMMSVGGQNSTSAKS